MAGVSAANTTAEPAMALKSIFGVIVGGLLLVVNRLDLLGRRAKDNGMFELPSPPIRNGSVTELRQLHRLLSGASCGAIRISLRAAEFASHYI
jgi:hypothetical protein